MTKFKGRIFPPGLKSVGSKSSLIPFLSYKIMDVFCDPSRRIFLQQQVLQAPVAGADFLIYFGGFQVPEAGEDALRGQIVLD